MVSDFDFVRRIWKLWEQCCSCCMTRYNKRSAVCTVYFCMHCTNRKQLKLKTYLCLRCLCPDKPIAKVTSVLRQGKRRRRKNTRSVCRDGTPRGGGTRTPDSPCHQNRPCEWPSLITRSVSVAASCSQASDVAIAACTWRGDFSQRLNPSASPSSSPPHCYILASDHFGPTCHATKHVFSV
jgi:hypothetical protein